MSREISVEVKKNLRLIDGRVKRIFETSARKCGNGAIVYVPKDNIEDKFYIIIVENSHKDKRKVTELA